MKSKKSYHRKKLRLLITAGPTREYIDPVRFISNDSSGQMGFAIAEAALNFGLEVILIAGPVTLCTPREVKRIDVVSAADMRRIVSKLAPKSDIVIMAAAVADFRPARFFRKKIKREKGDLRSIALAKNPDILKDICRKKTPNQIIVGFALETNDLQKNAIIKLKNKGCDLIIANNASTIGKKYNKATILHKDGRIIKLPKLDKTTLANVILSYVLDSKS